MRFYGWIVSDINNVLSSWNILGFILWKQNLNKYQLGYLYGLNSQLLFMDIKDVEEGKKLIKKLSKIKGFSSIKIINNNPFEDIYRYIDNGFKYGIASNYKIKEHNLSKILDHIIANLIIYEQRNPHLIYV